MQIRMRPRRPRDGGCDLRSRRHVRGFLGGPAEWRLTQIRMRPRLPWGTATCETVAIFVGTSRSDLIQSMQTLREDNVADPPPAFEAEVIDPIIGHMSPNEARGVDLISPEELQRLPREPGERGWGSALRCPSQLGRGCVTLANYIGDLSVVAQA